MSEPNHRQIIIARDTATRLIAAAEWLNKYTADAEILIVSPTREAGDEFVRNAAVAAGARFGLTRLTLNQLASVLAAPVLARAGRAPASGLVLTAVAARAVHMLMAEGALSYFEPVATRPGFPTAVARTLEELRMNTADASDIALLPRGGLDLAALLDRTDRELAEAKLADRAAVFAAAIEAARSSTPSHAVGLPLLLLDVQLTSKLEAQLIASLCARAPEVFATAARGDDRTISNLESALNCKAIESEEPDQMNSLGSLKRHLFEDTCSEPAKLDGTVTLTSWPGEARECVEIARSIQQEAARGVAFDRIAVFLRSPFEYGSHLEEAFRRAAIPAYFARGTSRPDAAGRALLALLACASEGLSARRFAEYVSLAQVPDPADADESPTDRWTPPRHDLIPAITEALIEEQASEDASLPAELEGKSIVDGTLRAPWRWERLLVESSVIGGEDRWKKRIEGLETELRLKRKELVEEGEETRAAGLDQQIRDIEHLREFALPLIKLLAALPQKATWGEWLARLSELAVSALREPEAVIETLAELAPMSPVGPVELFEVQQVLAPRLRELAIAPPRRRYGQVFVGSTDAARGMTFDVVFVPGLAEKLLPRKVVEDPILLDAERRQLETIDLTTNRDRISAERLALRLALGAASARAYLSYPRIDIQQARPRVPSFYGLEALRAAEGELRGFEELGLLAESGATARLGWPAPEEAGDAIDEAEYDLALLGRLVDADPETTAGTAHYLLDSNPHLARSLRARSRKWLRRWTAFDGLVDPDQAAGEALRPHQLSARSFSPTALQNYAACPYRFFLQAVHRLQPREEPAALEVIDPLTRGSLFHKVQYEVLTLLRAAEMLPVTPQNVDHAIAAVDDVLDRVAHDYNDKLWPAIPKVWEDGINAIRADLHEWLRRHADSADGWVPHKFELSFGLADRGREDEDPASVPDPVFIELRTSSGEAQVLKLRGSIDLVERHVAGKFRATDHKTGKARAKDGVVIGGGQHLQPVLYALACETLLSEPVESGRLYYCTADGNYEERVVMLDDFARGYAGIMVDTVRRALEEGFLPAAPAHDACVWCDFLAVCGPHEERRVRVKPQARLVELKGLRELP